MNAGRLRIRRIQTHDTPRNGIGKMRVPTHMSYRAGFKCLSAKSRKTFQSVAVIECGPVW